MLNEYSAHAVTGWIPSLPLPVRIKDSTLVKRRGSLVTEVKQLLDPRSHWLDPVATAPGSVPNPYRSRAFECVDCSRH